MLMRPCAVAWCRASLLESRVRGFGVSRVRVRHGEYGGAPSPVCQPGVYALSKLNTIEPGVIGGIGGEGGGNGGGSAAPGGTGAAQMVKPNL